MRNQSQSLKGFKQGNGGKERVKPIERVVLEHIHSVIGNFQMLKLDLEKTEEPEIKLPTSIRLSKKQESSRKMSTSVLLTV